MSQQRKHPPLAAWLLIALEILLGVGATISGTIMLVNPQGLEWLPLSMLEKTPFTTWTLPGLILLSLLGIYPLVVAYSLWRQPGWRWPDALNPWKNRHWSWAAALSTGIIVLTWIIVQMLMLRTIAGLQLLYLTWGSAILLLALAGSVKRYCAR